MYYILSKNNNVSMIFMKSITLLSSFSLPISLASNYACTGRYLVQASAMFLNELLSLPLSLSVSPFLSFFCSLSLLDGYCSGRERKYPIFSIYTTLPGLPTPYIFLFQYFKISIKHKYVYLYLKIFVLKT